MQVDGLLWVALAEDVPVGYAHVEMLAGALIPGVVQS